MKCPKRAELHTCLSLTIERASPPFVGTLLRFQPRPGAAASDRDFERRPSHAQPPLRAQLAKLRGTSGHLTGRLLLRRQTPAAFQPSFTRTAVFPSGKSPPLRNNHLWPSPGLEAAPFPEHPSRTSGQRGELSGRRLPAAPFRLRPLSAFPSRSRLRWPPNSRGAYGSRRFSHSPKRPWSKRRA